MCETSGSEISASETSMSETSVSKTSASETSISNTSMSETWMSKTSMFETSESETSMSVSETSSKCPRTYVRDLLQIHARPRPLCPVCQRPVSETSMSETYLSKTCVSKTSVCTFPGETGCTRPLAQNYSHVNGGINDPKEGAKRPLALSVEQIHNTPTIGNWTNSLPLSHSPLSLSLSPSLHFICQPSLWPRLPQHEQLTC